MSKGVGIMSRVEGSMSNEGRDNDMWVDSMSKGEDNMSKGVRSMSSVEGICPRG